MTDKELLELAAKAAGVNLQQWQSGFVELRDGIVTAWNPLKDDGDALRLAVKLHIDIRHFMYEKGYMDCIVDRLGKVVSENIENDQYAATRRAIVRAAAEIGKDRISNDHNK